MALPALQGEVLAGKYRVERVLGEGGMGIVVAATHLHLEQLVALKFMREETLNNAEAIQRFQREARAAVRLKSEHVARVLDVGTLDSGAPYIVMEFLEGTDLAALVASRGMLPVHDAVEYVLQACEAIAEAHGLGIVHRDLKPPNLFLTWRPDRTPCIKVLDFGISKVKSHAMTLTTTLMGSPNYMSPEQMSSAKDVDNRADVWALGVILYELLSGHAPFDAETIPQLCVKVMHTPHQSLRDSRADLPMGLDQVVSRCLEKDRSRRFQNIGELAQALAPFAPRRALASVERVSALTGPASPVGPTMHSAGGPHPMADPSTPPPYGPVPVKTNVAWTQTRPAPRLGGWAVAVVATAIGVLMIGAAVFVRAQLNRDGGVAATSEGPEPKAPAAPPTAEPPPTVAPVATAAPAPPETSEPLPPASAAPTAVARPPVVGGRPLPRPAGAKKGGGDDDVFGTRR